MLKARGLCRTLGTRRHKYTAAAAGEKPAVVIGIRPEEGENAFSLTEAGERLNSLCGGDISSRLAASGSLVKAGGSRLIGKVHPDHGPVIAVGLAKSKGVEEGLDHDRESVRKAAAAGVRAAAEIGATHVQGSGSAVKIPLCAYAKTPGMRIRFCPKNRIRGSTSKEGRFLKVYKMNILDNFKSSFLFSYFWYQVYH